MKKAACMTLQLQDVLLPLPCSLTATMQSKGTQRKVVRLNWVPQNTWCQRLKLVSTTRVWTLPHYRTPLPHHITSTWSITPARYDCYKLVVTDKELVTSGSGQPQVLVWMGGKKAFTAFARFSWEINWRIQWQGKFYSYHQQHKKMKPKQICFIDLILWFIYLFSPSGTHIILMRMRRLEWCLGGIKVHQCTLLRFLFTLVTWSANSKLCCAQTAGHLCEISSTTSHKSFFFLYHFKVCELLGPVLHVIDIQL